MEKSSFKKFRITFIQKKEREIEAADLQAAVNRAHELVALVPDSKLLGVEDIKPFGVQPPQLPPPPTNPAPARPAA